MCSLASLKNLREKQNRHPCGFVDTYQLFLISTNYLSASLKIQTDHKCHVSKILPFIFGTLCLFYPHLFPFLKLLMEADSLRFSDDLSDELLFDHSNKLKLFNEFNETQLDRLLILLIAYSCVTSDSA